MNKVMLSYTKMAFLGLTLVGICVPEKSYAVLAGTQNSGNEATYYSHSFTSQNPSFTRQFPGTKLNEPVTDPLPPAPNGFQWVVNAQLTDEFNGSQLDPQKWRPHHAWWIGRPPSKFYDPAVSVRDGMLQLTMLKLSPEQSTDTVWLGAPCVSSANPIVGLGYYEARIKASNSPLASAFFLQRRDGEEVDIAENFGASQTHPEYAMQNRTNTHYFVNGYKPEGDTQNITVMSTPNTEWHTYGLWYKDQYHVAVYIDHVLTSEILLKGPMPRPMYMFFDQEPSTAQGIPDDTALQNQPNVTMYVDWIHAYQLLPAVGPQSGRSVKAPSNNIYRPSSNYMRQ